MQSERDRKREKEIEEAGWYSSKRERERERVKMREWHQFIPPLQQMRRHVRLLSLRWGWEEARSPRRRWITAEIKADPPRIPSIQSLMSSLFHRHWRCTLYTSQQEEGGRNGPPHFWTFPPKAIFERRSMNNWSTQAVQSSDRSLL